MSNESKKRRRSCQRPEENQLEAKRIKLEPESMQSVEEGLSEHYIVKKKKKHKHHHSEINEVTEYLKAETPDMLQDGGCNINRLLEDDFESRPGKKHKHHRHRGNDTVVKSVETSDRYGLISEETAETESVNRSQTYATETVSSHKKKKKKKHRHYDEEDCHPQSEVELKQELVVPTDDSHSTDAAGNRVLESLTCDELDIDMSTQSLNCDTGKKKKKKKKKHVSQDYEGVQAVNAVKYEDMESELPLSDNGTSSWSSQAKSVSLQRQAETSCLLPCVKERCETHRPLQLHINTEEMRFNAGEDFKEFQLEDHSDRLWWEDVAANPNLEMWLVRAPLDFSASFIEGTRGMLYDSVLVPQPGRPGEGFQVSIQAVQQSKLVVLLPSKQDKKFHVASNVNGYVTITRSHLARIDSDVEPSATVSESECETNKKQKKKKHRSRETTKETTCEVNPKKHKKDRPV